MSDYISREQALAEVEELKKIHFDRVVVLSKISDRIEQIPSADVRENIKGKWKRTYLDHVAMGERPSILYCSVCCQCIAYPTNFCPNCGADMRGE